MKKQILFLTLSLFGFLAQAQDKDKLYALINEYSQRDGSFALSLNKDMLDAVDLDFDLDEHMKHISGDIYEVKLLLFSEDDQSKKLISRLDAGIKESGFKPIDFEPKDPDLKFFQIYGHHKKKVFDNIQILTLTETNNVIMLAINGKLKVKNLR